MIILALFFIIGCFLGSFLGVLVDRIPKNESFISGRSRCDSCKKGIAFYDLIPIVSFVLLRGRCRSCESRISYYYPIIEISSGLIFLLTFLFSGYTNLFEVLYYLILNGIFLAIFFIDLKYGIIPNRLVFPAIILTFLFFIGNPNNFINHTTSGVITFFFFLFISMIFYIISRKIGFGGGDLKLSFLIGLFLGFPNVVIALYLAFLTGAFYSLILIAWGKKRFFNDSIPFGPFLVVGVFISQFFGGVIIQIIRNILQI